MIKQPLFLVILIVFLGILAVPRGRCVDDTKGSLRVIPRVSTAGRKVHDLIEKQEHKPIDSDEEDYAVGKGEEQKETIAKVCS